MGEITFSAEENVFFNPAQRMRNRAPAPKTRHPRQSLRRRSGSDISGALAKSRVIRPQSYENNG